MSRPTASLAQFTCGSVRDLPPGVPDINSVASPLGPPLRPSGPWGPWGVGRTRFRFRKHVAPGGGTPGRPFQYVFGPSWRSGRPRRAGLCAPAPHACPSGPGELGDCPRRKGPVVRRDSWQPGPVPRVSRPVRGRVSAYGVRDASCCLLRSHTRARRIRLVREVPSSGFSERAWAYAPASNLGKAGTWLMPRRPEGVKWVKS